MTGPRVIPDCVIPLQDAHAQTQSTRQLLADVFPSWNIDRVDVMSLKGGITNCLLKCIYKAGTPQEIVVLVRAYGRGTGSIIDRNREFCTHVHLHSYGLAPPLHARFKNGLVYGFIAGRSVDYHELSNPILMRGISRMLAQWHTVLDASAIKALMLEQSGLKSHEFVDDIWQLCQKWINNLPTDDDVQVKTKTVLAKELVWVKNEIQYKGGPTVVAHCDLLSGNVIVPEDWSSEICSDMPPVTFIDYEYALPTPRAFDLANHFMEWQGFDCNVSLIPKVGGPVMREWGKQYLEGTHLFKRGSSEKQQNGVPVSDADVDHLMQEIRTWWGMPGFYWGIWATIQAVISTIEFDYTNYAQNRLSEYWSWKQNYLSTKKPNWESNL
ncbi:kinase-like domain-containing protein [Lipomyces doorenjongii]|uniref:kinase-like domain-containing protein n=1 Tax=Lipomyces doorenjongii TaxID=383834 RepID=UPI0034CED7CB